MLHAGRLPSTCYCGAMTTSQRMDAVQMAKYRRRPMPDTAQSAAYLEMMREVHRFQSALTAANPDVSQAELLREKIAEITSVLETLRVPEHERLYALGDMGSSEGQALLPPLTMDYMDDDVLRAHFVASEFAMGMNQAMHGGVISAIFDTSMGRLSAGSKIRVSRTAYLTTQYRNVAPIGERLELRCWVVKVEGRKRFIQADLRHGDTLCAEADALFVEVRPGSQ